MEAVTIQPKNPGEMMVLAIQHGADPAVLQKLIEIQAQWEAMQARKAYVKAMAAFKTDCPAVLKKDAEVDFTSSRGRTHYKHATLGGIVLSITPLLSQNGLSVSFETEQKENRVGVTCHITHELGHRESTKLSGPNDDSGNKNAIQAVGSAVTYLQRYTLLAALGLATAEQDDDGFQAEVAAAGKEGAAKAADILNQKRTTAPAASQQAEQPRGEESQVPAGTSVVTGKIEQVTRKPGGTKEKPWLRFGVQVGGVTYGTFDKKHGELAEKAYADGIEVEITWEKVDKYTNLTGITVLGDLTPADDQEPTGNQPFDRDALIAEIDQIIKTAPSGPVSRAMKQANTTHDTWDEMMDADLVAFKQSLVNG